MSISFWFAFNGILCRSMCMQIFIIEYMQFERCIDVKWECVCVCTDLSLFHRTEQITNMAVAWHTPIGRGHYYRRNALSCIHTAAVCVARRMVYFFGVLFLRSVVSSIFDTCVRWRSKCIQWYIRALILALSSPLECCGFSRYEIFGCFWYVLPKTVITLLVWVYLLHTHAMYWHQRMLHSMRLQCYCCCYGYNGFLPVFSVSIHLP